MLVDSDSFISVEKKLVKQGKLQKFEKENGPVFISEIVNNLTDSTGIDLPIWVFINDKAHLAVTKKDLS